MGCHLLLQGIFLSQGSKLSLVCLLHWQEGSSPLAAPSQVHTALNCILVFFSWSCTHTEKNLQNLQLQLEGWCPEVTQDLRVPAPEGPRLGHPPGWLGPSRPGSIHRDVEMPGDPLSAQARGACVSFTLFPGAQDWGGRGQPNLSAAGDELGMPPTALMGFGGQSWHLQREMGKPPVGIFKEDTLEQQLLDSCTRWPHSAPSLWSSQPSNLGGVCGRDLCPGKTCSGHPPLICMDYYHLLSVLFWSHSTGDLRGFAGDSEAPASEFRT